MSDRTLVHDEAAGRYELRAGDAVLGFAAYLPAGPSVIVSHTEVDPGHKGEGLGSELVRATLDAIRASGKHGDPQLPVHGGLHLPPPGVRRPRRPEPARVGSPRPALRPRAAGGSVGR